MSGPGYPAPTGLPEYPPPAAVDVPQVSDDAVVPSVQDVSLDFTESQFNPHSASGNMSGKPAVPPAASNAPLLTGGQDSALNGDQPPSKASFFSWKRFQKHFDVETKDVTMRMGYACLGPFKRNFFETVEDNVDMYGPFWIPTTLVFLTAVTTNMVSYYKTIGQEDRDKDWISDYGKLMEAAILYYGYVFGVGFCLWAFLRWFRAGVHLSHVWCIYGYTLTIFLPVSVVLATNIAWLRWLGIGIATLYSGSFLLLNFKAAIFHAAPARATIALLVMAILHLTVGVVLAIFYKV